MSLWKDQKERLTLQHVNQNGRIAKLTYINYDKATCATIMLLCPEIKCQHSVLAECLEILPIVKK